MEWGLQEQGKGRSRVVCTRADIKSIESTSVRKTTNRITRPSCHPLKLPSVARDTSWREPSVEEAGLELFGFSTEKWISFKPHPN